jgi:hypothetical protein
MSWPLPPAVGAARSVCRDRHRVVGVRHHGVISYSVAQRTHEIGIRAAPGASPTNLVGLVVGRGMALTAIGLAVASHIVDCNE